MKMSDSIDTAKWLERYKILWEISEASPIIRRYFAMNFFDGVLTALGIVLPGLIASIFSLGQFQVFDNGTYFLTGLTTAIAIGISGLTGSHLAESAERKLNVLQMKQVLGLQDHENNNSEGISEEPQWSESDLRLALGRFERSMGDPKGVSSKPVSLQLGLTSEQAQKLGVNLEDSNNAKLESQKSLNKSKKKLIPLTEVKRRSKKDDKDKGKTIFEEAQDFAGKIAAAVDGLSPFLGVLVVIVPFLFGAGNDIPSLMQFVVSYGMSIFVLFMLGRYLAKLSKASVLKYGLQMVGAAVLTSVVTLIFQMVI